MLDSKLALQLRPDLHDELAQVIQTSGEDDLVMATRQGRICRFHEREARAMGRTAGGVIGTVIDCYRAGGAEVYVLRTPDGGELDLPAVASIIVTFKPREGVIVADLTGSDLVPRPPKRAKPTRPASSVRTP